jgi:hypothetical protein
MSSKFIIERSLRNRILWVCAIILLVITCCIALTNIDIITGTLINKSVPFILLAIGLLLGLLVGSILNGGSKSRGISLHGVLEFKMSESMLKTAFIIIGVMFTITLIVLIIVSLFEQPRATWTKYLINFFTDSPGGFFGIIAGTLTILGTYLAFVSVSEMKHTITSYAQLIERVIELIDTKNSGAIRIVSYFPIPGYWQLKRETKKREFLSSLKRKDKDIEYICLHPTEHLLMLLTIAKLLKNKTADEIIDFQGKSYSLIEYISGKNVLGFDEDIDNEKKYKRDTHFLPWDNMPPYYFFISEKKAIVVTPVGLPTINYKMDVRECSKEIANVLLGDAGLKAVKEKYRDEIDLILSYSKNKKDSGPHVEEITESLKESDRGHGGAVETLGFETNDRHLIEELHVIFDNLKKHPKCDKINLQVTEPSNLALEDKLNGKN